MAKSGGLGQRFFVAGVDVSGDISSIDNCYGGPAALDFTGIDKEGMERQGGKRNGGLDFTSFFNPTGAHPVFSALPTADQVLTWLTGTALGAPAAAMIYKQIDYAPKLDGDGSLTFSVAAQANISGLEWGVNGTAGIRTDVAATNGTGVDGLTASTFGLQAYLQVFAFTGTSVTVKLQDSPDNVTFTDVGGGAFTAATGVTTQRIATASGLSVARYLRVATTGTFSNAQFHVAMMRNRTATAF